MSLKEYLQSGLNKKAAIALVPNLQEGTKVPKILHQTFYSKDLPPLIRENAAKIRAMNVDWEYRFYDNDDISAFISECYGPRILEAYNRISPEYGAARADIFRYLLMYKVGGVYLDIKSTMERPLNEVIRSDDAYLLSFWRNNVGETHQGWGLHSELKHIGGGELQQWYIVAVPGHPFLKAVIENVLGNIEAYNPIFHGTGKIGVLRLTGPIAYTLAIIPLLQNHKHRFVDSESDLGFRYSIFDFKAHTTIFKTHYTHLNVSVVKTSIFMKFLLCGKNYLKRVHVWLQALRSK